MQNDVRLIDANALPMYKVKIVHSFGIVEGSVVFPDDIKKAPTISAVPVEHGLPYAANHLGVVCSYCCKWSDNDYNYCPNCGAKMDAKDMDVPTKDGGASDG